MNDFLMYAAGGTAISALLAWAFKHLLMQALSGKTAFLTSQASDVMMQRLQAEITRLEAVITKQRSDYEERLDTQKRNRDEEMKSLKERLDDFALRIEALRSLELQDATDIAELALLLDTTCAGCSENNVHADRMKGIIVRIRERKNRGRHEYSL